MLYPKPARKPKQRTRRKDQNKLYGELVKPAYLRGLAAGQGRVTAMCECCRAKAAVQIHHKRGRLGADLLDSSHFMGVCDDCHRLIHERPQWAYAQGFLGQRSGWNAEGDEHAPQEGQ